MIKTAIRDSYSKLILTGEHAVVYGKPAIAMPFPLKVRSIIEESIGDIIFESNIYTGIIYNMPSKFKGISDCIKETLKCLNQPVRDLKIKIDSSIPIGRGLGSSAAISIAIVKSLFSFFQRELSQKELFFLVEIAETHAHGNPSGLDMMAEASENPIWFEKGKDIIPIEIGRPLYLVVGDTGLNGDTKRAVENVKERYLSNPKRVQNSLDEIERISIEARGAIERGDIKLLGKLFNENQKQLISLGVSDDNLNKLIETSLSSGALGAKLTGGGLGGCMIALVSSLDEAKVIGEKLVESGADKSWYFSTDKDILYVSKV